MVACGFLCIDPDVLAMVVRLDVGGTVLASIVIGMCVVLVMVSAKLTIIVVRRPFAFHRQVLQFSAAVVEVYASSRCRESVYERKPYGK